jgi:hypothetical protein
LPETGLMRVYPGEQSRPGGAAARAIVELREAHALGRQFVYVGCEDFRALTAEVGKAKVVGNNDDHIRARGRAVRRQTWRMQQ